MTVLGAPPSNQNFLGKNGFVFSIKKMPNTNFFVQGCNIPGISIEPVIIGTPLVNFPFSGDHIDYGEFTITFKVDEGLGAYLDVHNWMRGLGFPTNSEEYAELAAQPRMSGNGITSDASLLILDAKKRTQYALSFTDAFPVSLSALDLGYDIETIEYLTATATFRYTYFNIDADAYGGGP